MINIERYIQLNDLILRSLTTIQAGSEAEWFDKASEITDITDIHNFSTLWRELKDYGQEIQYIQNREADDVLFDLYESRLQHIVILAQRLIQLGRDLGVSVK
jgi:hypothetical protein